MSEEESESAGELTSNTARRAHEVDGIGTVAVASGYVAGCAWKGVVVDMVVIVGVGRGVVEEEVVVDGRDEEIDSVTIHRTC